MQIRHHALVRGPRRQSRALRLRRNRYSAYERKSFAALVLQLEGQLLQEATEEHTREEESSSNNRAYLAQAWDGPFRLFNLPQELQDLTFDFAYPAGGAIISRNVWEHIETQTSIINANYQPRAFERRIDSFLVSKRYFVAAVPAYVANQSLDRRLCITSQGLFHAYATRIPTPLCRVYAVRDAWSLKHLDIPLGPTDLGVEPGTLPFTELMTEEQIRKSSAFQEFSTLSGLTTFILTLEERELTAVDPRWPVLEANVQKLEALVILVVTKPKPTDQRDKEYASKLVSDSEPVRLYEGSKVFFSWPPSYAGCGLGVPEWYAYGSALLKRLGEEKSAVTGTEQENPVNEPGMKFGKALDHGTLHDGEIQHDGNGPSSAEASYHSTSRDPDPVDIANHLIRVAASRPPQPTPRLQDIPDTDKEIFEMIASSPASIAAILKAAKAKEIKSAEAEAQALTIGEILAKLGVK